MSLSPYIAGWAYMPLDMLGPRVPSIKKVLSIHPRHFDNSGPPPAAIEVWDNSVPGFIGLPIDWALQTFPKVDFEDRTVLGGECYYNKLPDPHHPRAPVGQDVFMRDLLDASRNYYTVLGKAATGSGKTVVGLNTAAQLGRRTLILMHLERLGRQWAEEVHDKLGIPYDEIGWVQGDVCNWDAPYVIGISKSISGRRYPKAFYNAFGTVIYDEVHRVGAPTLSQSLGLFPARHKIALTATDRRKDGCSRVFHYYFGKPCVQSQQQSMPITVHSIPHLCNIPAWAKFHGVMVKALTEDEERNRKITRALCTMYDEGRNFLAIGDSTTHLQDLIKRCGAEGIPFKDMGLFVNERYSGQDRETYAKVKAASLKQRLVYHHKKSESDPAFPDYTPITITKVLGGGYFEAAQTGAAMANYRGTVHLSELRHLPTKTPILTKVPHETLDRIKAESVGIWATYGMLKEGIDIPRLDAGMDVTPRADGEQVIGRVRRLLEGKMPPYWVTIRDRGHPTVERYYKARVKEYRGCGAEIVEHESY